MWKKITITAPPLRFVVETIVSDENGNRNEQRLKFDGKPWWLPDGSMYVYYTPTHWRYIY